MDKFDAQNPTSPQDRMLVYFPYMDNYPPAKVVEWTRMPSGKLVVIIESGESLWFEADGRCPKGSYLSPYPVFGHRANQLSLCWQEHGTTTKPDEVPHPFYDRKAGSHRDPNV